MHADIKAAAAVKALNTILKSTGMYQVVGSRKPVFTTELIKAKKAGDRNEHYLREVYDHIHLRIQMAGVSACAIHLQVAVISDNDECNPHSQQLC